MPKRGSTAFLLGVAPAHTGQEMKKPTHTKNEGADDSLSGTPTQVPEPNKNLMIIEKIEGSMNEANESLESLENNLLNRDQSAQKKPPYIRKQAIDKALEEIDLFQKTTLFELRRAFE